MQSGAHLQQSDSQRRVLPCATAGLCRTSEALAQRSERPLETAVGGSGAEATAEPNNEADALHAFGLRGGLCNVRLRAKCRVSATWLWVKTNCTFLG